MEEKPIDVSEYMFDTDGRRTLVKFAQKAGIDYTMADLEADIADGSVIELALKDGRKILHVDDGAFTVFVFPGVVLGPNDICKLWNFYLGELYRKNIR